jgi:two-component system LytT family sensor kinase
VFWRLIDDECRLSMINSSGRNRGQHQAMYRKVCLTLSKLCHVKFQQFLFSDSRRQRVFRHVFFWGIYTLNFLLRSLKPLTNEELFQQRIYTNALLEVCCFMPVCVFFVYSFNSYLLPLIKGKNFVRFSLLFLLIYLLGIVINYFAALIFINNRNISISIANNFYDHIEHVIGSTRGALCIGIVVIGIALAKAWYLQTRTNLAMLKSNAKARMRIEKSRINPEWLFNGLNKINANLLVRSSTSPAMILNLSDVLSYSLYDSDEDLVQLERELLEVQHLVALGQGDTTSGFSVLINTSGDIENWQIAPMSVINKIVAHISVMTKTEKRPCTLDLHFRARQNMLVLHLKMICDTDKEMTTIQWPLTRRTNSVSD